MSSLHDKATVERKDTEFHRILKYRDGEHTPYNKRHGEEVSVMIFTVEAHRKSDWVSIHTSEFRTNKKNDVREITHSITLRADQALALRNILNEQFPIITLPQPSDD